MPCLREIAAKVVIIRLRLDCRFGQLEDLSPEQLGLFAHEYIHYLQNITTPWGLLSSIVTYESYAETLAAMQQADVIDLPFVVNHNEKHLMRRSIIDLTEGCSNFS